jgi:hypothetical protein
MDALRRNERFQEDMRDAAVRAIVDAVIADPEKGPIVRNREAMACLNKMRELRDILRLNGGGAIDLEEILRPWDESDDKRVKGTPSFRCLICFKH